MSYILDALNKSERERRSDTTPELNSIYRQMPPKTTSNSRWIVIVVFFALVNVAALWVWLSSSVPAEAPQPASGPDADPTYVATAIPTTLTPTTTAPTAIPNESKLIKPDDVALTLQDINPVRLSELPINIQRQIPDLKFSSHLYSNNPTYRMVNINGKMVQEGDNVADGFRLIKITEAGVVLSFRHYQFEVSVLRDWRFD